MTGREPRAGDDRCPGALRLHAAADGGLARVRVPGGRLGPAQLRALADAAALGNGLLDVTSRANVQVRGLPPGAADRLGAVLTAAGLLPAPAHERVRNILASPVAGRAPGALAASDPVVAAVDRGLCDAPALAALPGRFLFAVDDGTGRALAPRADVALVAVAPDAFGLVLDGRFAGPPVAAGAAAGLAVAAAAAFLDVRTDRGWRIAELPGGAEAVAARLGLALGAAAGPARGLAAGRLAQSDGRVAVTALVPLGRLDAEALRALAAAAGEVRLGAGRTITVPDVAPGDVPDVEALLDGLGLDRRGRSGWTGLSACAGQGRCPRARADVRAAAARRARVRDAGDPPEHWAACERRCGEGDDQPVAVAAGPDGVRVRRGSDERAVATIDEALEVLA